MELKRLPDLPAWLLARLREPLPGHAAQRRMEPQLCYGRHAGPAAHDARQAAVVMLLYRGQGRWHLPLTLRPAHLPDHAGQISLPGGMIEYGESSRTAALRELDEELGVNTGIKMLGKLTELYVYVSNFWVTPWVAVVDGLPHWRLNPDEVEQLIELPIDHLLDPAAIGQRNIHRRGLRLSAPCFALEEHQIWGATAMMLAELAVVIQEAVES